MSKFVDPILDDPGEMEEVVSAAKKRPEATSSLRKIMQRNGDLVNASMFPETDVDVITSITMRFLQENVFEKMLLGILPELVEMVNFIEVSMKTNTEPKRGM